ncbi:MAG: dTMP kinase [Candidatus Gribaldobacteria bacterium]|nr:dTMP kinase [Candidatus Gribaldobacteria bacterium]
MANQSKGKFIVFDALDGSGQSTQIEFLGNFLQEKGYDVLITKEPTKESEFGQKIRRILQKKEKVSPADLQKLFVEDRKWHLEQIILPHLEKDNSVVISDRYFLSTLCFGRADGLDENWLWEMNKDFLMPDFIIFLDVKPEVCVSRIEKRGEGQDLFEVKEKLEKAYNHYIYILEKFKKMTNVLIIDGVGSAQEVFQEIKNKLNL